MPPLSQQLLHYYRFIWWGLFLLSALPGVRLIYHYFSHQLGANPLQALEHSTGNWALIFLLITLGIAPLRQILNALCVSRQLHDGRRLEDWNWLVRPRRMLGLYSFFYATGHTLIYVLFDLSLNWSWALQDITQKPYIAAGALAYLMQIPLAATSASLFFHLLGKDRWRRLHKTSYLILLIAVIHVWWQTKLGVDTAWPYALAAAFLFGFRLANKAGILPRQPQDDEMEAEPRT